MVEAVTDGRFEDARRASVQLCAATFVLRMLTTEVNAVGAAAPADVDPVVALGQRMRERANGAAALEAARRTPEGRAALYTLGEALTGPDAPTDTATPRAKANVDAGAR